MRPTLVLIGDVPLQPTGLGRLATDLGRHLWAAKERLGVDLLHVGQVQTADLPAAGVPLRMDVPWPVWAYPAHGGDVVAALKDALTAEGLNWDVLDADRPVILLAAQDPARSYELLDPKLAVLTRWGYFLVDALNLAGTLGGPPALAIQQFDRVLAYGPYGSHALARLRHEAVPALPHGIDLPQWRGWARTHQAEAATLLNPTGDGRPLVGCVATNVARKDLALFVRTLQFLRDRGTLVHGWLHTDREVGDWALPQLVADAGFDWRDLTVTLAPMPDATLAACYAACAVTIAPGRGEGFGYPILESLAVGVPTIHVADGGGADFPRGAGLTLVQPDAHVPQGLYGLLRPVLHPSDVATAVERLLRRAEPWPDPETTVGGYDWATLWPKWETWIAQGLADLASPAHDHRLIPIERL